MYGAMSRAPGSLPTFENCGFAAEPIEIAGAELIPEGRITAIQWPWGHLRWVRPTAVLVRSGPSQERVRIVDATRVAQIAMLAMAAAFWAIGLIIVKRRGQSERERCDR